MSNTYSRCILCERRHKPDNCEIMREMEEVEQGVKPHSTPKYENRNHPLAKHSNLIGNKQDGYNFLVLMIFSVVGFVLFSAFLFVVV